MFNQLLLFILLFILWISIIIYYNFQSIVIINAIIYLFVKLFLIIYIEKTYPSLVVTVHGVFAVDVHINWGESNSCSIQSDTTSVSSLP